MVLRKLAMALLSIGVVLPGLTHALALREVKTKSALGEPFHAEIELAELADLTEEDIKVTLAQAEDFARLGIEEVYILAELRFNVVVKQDGRSYIKITTHRRVTEPFLDFIIRVSWPNNTRLQQVTALLDPPMTKVTKAESVLAPIVAVQTQPVIETVTPPAMVEPITNEPVNSYRVRKNDTLWKVARRVRPSPAISVSQMMKVLHQANPQAFIANNINWLKDGQVLRVPSLMDTQSVAELKNATPAQSPALMQAQAANKPLARQQIDATAPKSASVAPSAPRAQMKLVTATASQPQSASSTGLAQATSKTTISNTATTTQKAPEVAGVKSVQKIAKNNQVLAKELSSLETQLKLNDKKIAMQNAKLAQLEAQLKARRLAEQAKHSDKKADLDKKAVATLACALAMQSFLTTEAKAEEAATTATTVAPAKPEGGSSMVPIIGGGLVLVIVALIFFLKSKGKKDQPAPPAVKPQAPAAKPATPPAAKAEAPVAAPTPVAKPAPVEPAKPQDPLEEVRPYLEMERYPQAVGLLTKALVQHPDRADIHLKLLEIFAKQKDRSAFDDQYRQLEALGELEAIVAADKLKQQFPEEPKPASVNKEGALEFTSSAKPATPAAPVVEEAPAFSLDDLENDFKMSLSNPNMKALDIPLAPDPIELQQPEEPVVESHKIAELDSLLDGGLEFKFDQKAPVAPAEEHQGLDFSFETPEPEPVKTDVGTGLSLDSLDDFLAEHKIEAEPVVEEAPVAGLDFEQELAKFKEEKQEVEPEENLAEGFELEEFKLDDSVTAKEDDLGFDVADADFSIEEQPLVEEKSEFKLDFDTPSADLSDMVASFDKEELADVELPDDLNFDDVDVSVSSDDVLAELDKEFSFLATTNENSTRLDLARAYLEMGDRLGARDLLEEVVAEGDSNQKTEAQGMLMRIA